MRANPTDAERKIWQLTRAHRLQGFKIKRQQIIAPFIVDFICFERRIIIEADGSQHADSRYDARRDNFLRRQGFAILRLWNDEILRSPAAAYEAIAAILAAPPSPARGQGKNGAVYA